MSSSLVENRILRLREGRLCKILVGDFENRLARVVSIDQTINTAMIVLFDMEAQLDTSNPVRDLHL